MGPRFEGGRIGRIITGPLHVFGSGGRITEKVDHLVGQGGLLGAFQNGHFITGNGGAFDGNEDFDFGVFLGDLPEVTAVALDEVKLAGIDAGFVTFVVELGDVDCGCRLIDCLTTDVGDVCPCAVAHCQRNGESVFSTNSSCSFGSAARASAARDSC